MSPPRRSSAGADDNVYRVANQKLVCTIMIREECSLWKLQVREAKTAHWIKFYLISMANKSAWIFLCINYIYNPSTPYPSPFENQRFVCCMKVKQWSFLLIPHFLPIHICNGSRCPVAAVEGGESGVTVSIIQGKQPVECTHFSMDTFGKPPIWLPFRVQYYSEKASTHVTKRP